MVHFVPCPGLELHVTFVFKHTTSSIIYGQPQKNQTLERISGDFSPEADFAARGMTVEEFPGRYPYRDFGLQYWDATHTWVKEYLDASILLGVILMRLFQFLVNKLFWVSIST